MGESASPVLSVIVAIVSDTTESRVDVAQLIACLESLSTQVQAPPIEIIVPIHQNVDGIDRLRRQFPSVIFLPVDDVKTAPGQGGREHHDVLRARGLIAAKGRLVGLVEDHATLDPTWCSSVVAAHENDYAAVGGAIENGIDRTLNWAVYYCDFGKYENPVPAGESSLASDANVTYKRTALEGVREAWIESFREVVVNGALAGRGEKIALSPKIVVYQKRRGLRLRTALRERFIWGRSYAATRSGLLSGPKRMLYFALSPVLPLLLLLRMTSTAWKRGKHLGEYARAVPLIALLVTVWSIGEAVGYIVGVESPARAGLEHSA